MFRLLVTTLALVVAVHGACRDLDQQACDGESTCVFQYFPSSICRNKGCLDFQETDCPSATCVALPAEVGAAYKLCYAKDDNKPCNDPSHSNGNCPQKCTFDFGDGTCRDKQCKDFFSQDSSGKLATCIAAGCTSFALADFMSICVEARGPECADLTMYQDKCTAASYCQWKDLGGSGVCYEPNDMSKFGCSIGYDLTPTERKAACESFKGTCAWSTITGDCYRADKPQSCNDMWSCQNCAALGGCTWSPSTYSCSACTGGDCNLQCDATTSMPMFTTSNNFGGSTVGPDTPCSERDLLTCQGKCKAEFSSSGAYQGCSDAECKDLFSESLCTSSGCTYDASAYRCFPPDNGKACAQQTAGTCPSRCFLAGETCRDQLCSDVYSADGCAANAKCAWTELQSGLYPVGVCLDKGAPVECEMVSLYVYQGGDVACAKIDGCEWSSEAQYCNKAGAAIPCSAYRYASADCTANGCNFVQDSNNGCLEKGVEAVCSDIYTARGCNPQPNCVYKDSRCTACSGAACDDFDSTTEAPVYTTEKVETLPPDTVCTDITSQGACLKPCLFDFVLSKCRSPLCVDARDSKECETIAKNCEYIPDMFMCSKKDTGAACDSYAYNSCPLARCVRAIPDGDNSQATCRDKDCSDFYDETSCKAFSSECAFKGFSCWRGSVDKPPCRNLYGEDCDAASHCEQNPLTNMCEEIGAVIACGRLSGDAGISECEKRADCTSLTENSFSICYASSDPVPCNLIWDATACKAAGAACFYDARSTTCSRCNDKDGCADVETTLPPIDTTPCRELSGDQCVLSEVCKVEFSAGSACVDAKCQDAQTQQACEYLQCAWDGFGLCKVQDDGKACSSYTTWDECNAAVGRCAADFSATGSIACRNAACMDLFDSGCKENVGKGLMCRWSELGFCTTEDGKDLCDRIYGESNCAASQDCEYKAGVCVGLGQRVPCQSIYDKDSCGLDCIFYQTSSGGLCREKTDPVPCSMFSSQSLCAPSSACTWHSDSGICAAIGEEIKCSDIYMFGACYKAPDCQWNDAMYLCEPCTGDACNVELEACNTFTAATCPFNYCSSDGSKCIDQPCTQRNSATCTLLDTVCEYQDAYSMCTDKGAKVQCGNLYDQTSCGSLSSCVWLKDSYRCIAQGELLPCNQLYSAAECDNPRCNWVQDTFCQEPVVATTIAATTTDTTRTVSDSGRSTTTRTTSTITTTVPTTKGSTSPTGVSTTCDTKLFGPCEECDLAGTMCLKCRADRYLYEKDGVMRCNPQVTCAGSSFEEVEFGLTDRKCNCRSDQNPTGDCFRCVFTGGSLDSAEAPKTCVRCKNKKYLALSSVCGEASVCEAGTVATMPGTYGLRCQPPFTCKKNKNLQFSTSTKALGAASFCKCSPGCMQCKWDANGETCLDCKASKFLLNGACADACPPTFTHYGVSAYKRFCAAPFVCNNRKIVGGAAKARAPTDACRCKAGCTMCQYAAGNTAGIFGTCLDK